MFDDSFPYQQAAYTRGYLAAETDIRQKGIAWVQTFVKDFDAARDGFTLGYLTALGVAEERARGN